MGFQLLIHICALLCLGGYGFAEQPGTDFAVAFMQNFLPDDDNLTLKVLLTAFFPETKVAVQLSQNDQKDVLLRPGSPVTFDIMKEMEILSSTRSMNTVRIISNKPISVVATNSKLDKTSVTVLSPVADWGVEYYVVMPSAGPEESTKQMAIVNGPQPNFISILLKGVVEFENSLYLPGDHLNRTLDPWEAVQLQSTTSLTGSHVLSQKPVALFAGQTCAERRGECQVCLQLPPVCHWGSTFVTAPLPFQKSSSKIYLLAGTTTAVTVQQGNARTSLVLTAGEVEKLNFDPTTELLISSFRNLLVLLYFSEGLNEPIEGFVFNLAPKEQACRYYSIVWVPRFRNLPLVLGHANARETLQLNHKFLPPLDWKDVPGTDLVYTLLPINRGDYHIVQNPASPFGVVTIGTAPKNSYCATGICLDKVHNLCGFGCPDERRCRKHPACMSPKTQTCMAWGATHLRTFQGTHHLQPGTCPSVLLASLGKDQHFGPFRLERRPDDLFTIWLDVFEKRLEIPVTVPGTVLVNEELKYTPLILEDGKLNITRFGLYTSVKASFGLHVIIADRDGFVHIEIPRIYSGVIFGLCVNQYPTEWSSQDDNPNCNSTSLSPNLCETMNVSGCNQILKSEIFQACHPILDPTPFVQSCKSEVCETGKVCKGLGAYALACGIEGVDMSGWRPLHDCDLQCPPNSHYEGCLSSFHTTCLTTQSPIHDAKSCFETCACDDGFQLDMWGSCVHPNECGCFFEERYYSPGEKFYLANCYTICQCTGTKVQCYDTQGCDPGSECVVRRGHLTCKPQKFASCYLSGSSEFVRLDDQRHPWNGPCMSTMVEVCSRALGLTYFSVTLIQERDAPYIIAEVYGKRITLFPQMGQASVNGVFVQTPYAIEGQLLIHAVHPWQMTLYTNFGLLISEINGNLLIKIPDSYLNGVCGLCSSADNRPSRKPACNIGCRGICPSCHPKKHIRYLSKDSCGMLTDPSGPFRACHGRVNPESYINKCVNDLCGNKTLCLSFSSYVSACREAGVAIEWRSSTLCDFSCPPNSYYSTCSSGCPAACGTDFPLVCPLSCEEGCICNPGYVWGVGGCVLPEDCGCPMPGGGYLNQGDVFYKDCQVACTCMHGEVICANHSCSANEMCQTMEGEKACYPKPLTCWVSGERGYSFDGTFIGARRDCMYTMVSDNCAANSIPDLDIAFQQSKLLDGYPSTIHSTKLTIYGHTIIVKDLSDVEVDGINSQPSYLTKEVTILPGRTGKFSYVQITTNSGILLMVSSSMVWINLPSSYAGNICGLCGNANGNSSDDLEGLHPGEFLSSHGGLCYNSLEANGLYNLTAGGSALYNLTGEDFGIYNLTAGGLGLYNLTVGDLSNMTTGDLLNLTARDLGLYNLTTGDLLNLTTGDLGLYNLTTGDLLNMTASDSALFNLTTGDLGLYNLTTGDLLNLTASDFGLYNLTTGDLGLYNLTTGDLLNLTASDFGLYNLTTGDLGLYNLTTGDLLNLTASDFGLYNLTTGDLGLYNLTTGDLLNLTASDFGLYNLTTGDLGLYNLTTGDLLNLTARDFGLYNLTTGDLGLYNLTTGDLLNMTASDSGLYNLTTGDLGLYNLTTGDLLNLTASDFGLYNLTTGDLGLYNLTTGDLLNLTASDFGLYNLTTGDLGLYNLTTGDLLNLTARDFGLYNLTTGDLGLYNLTTGDLLNMTASDSGLYNLTTGDLGLYNLTTGDLLNMTASDFGLYNQTSGDLLNLTAGNLGLFNLTTGDQVNMTASDSGLPNKTLANLLNLMAGDLFKLAGSDLGLVNLSLSCGVLVEEAFRNCHTLIDPSWFFDTCLHCASSDNVLMVCLIIKAYSTECLAAGVTVDNWEENSICGFGGLLPVDSPPTQFADEVLISDQNDLVCFYDKSLTSNVSSNSSALRPAHCSLPLASVANATALEHFSVQLHDIIGLAQTVTYLEIKVYGVQVLIPAYGSSYIWVDGLEVTLPVYLASNKTLIILDDPFLIFMTDFGFYVIYGWGLEGEVLILAPAYYQNNLYGWCSQVKNPSKLPEAQHLCFRTDHWSCDNEPTAQSRCGLLMAENGPFQSCHQIFPPQMFHKECRRRVCESGGNQQDCDALYEYARGCEANGVLLRPWRQENLCGKEVS